MMQREVTIYVKPYTDGSGYVATVKAYLDPEEGPVFYIHVVNTLAAEDWPELQQAVEAAVRAVTPPPSIKREADEPTQTP